MREPLLRKQATGLATPPVIIILTAICQAYALQFIITVFPLFLHVY